MAAGRGLQLSRLSCPFDEGQAALPQLSCECSLSFEVVRIVNGSTEWVAGRNECAFFYPSGFLQSGEGRTLIEPWPAGRAIHLIHDAAFEPESFNPGIDAAGTLRNPTRFAPIRDAKGRVVPYLYGGTSRDCAIFETVFHNVPIDSPPDKFVDLDDFANRAHGRIVPQRDLQLVNLTTDGLHRLKVPKAELITSAPIDYLDTARWAEALHHQFPDVDGLFWIVATTRP